MDIDMLDERKLDDLLYDPKVKKAMRIRCEERGHDFENCCSVFLEVYQRCRWCKERR